MNETDSWPIFQANTKKLTSAEEINKWFLFVAKDTIKLTEKGRAVRLNALRARWRELFGDANFVVDD